MKKKVYKFISLMLIMALLLPLGGEAFKAINITAYAEEALDEASLEAIEDYESVIEYKAGDWGKAVFKDGLPWNYFHNAVQNDIREKNKNQVEYDELSVIKPDGKIGRVDLWRIEKKSKTAYYWEVKPLSYLKNEERLLSAEQQLENYTNDIDSDGKYRKGNTGNGPYISGETFSSDNRLYKITYYSEKNGLIFYSFERNPYNSSSQNENSRAENTSSNINIPDYNNTLVYDNVASYDQAKSNLETFVMANPDIIATLINPATFEMYKNIANYLYGFSTTYPGNETSIAEEASTTSLIVIISIESLLRN